MCLLNADHASRPQHCFRRRSVDHRAQNNLKEVGRHGPEWKRLKMFSTLRLHVTAPNARNLIFGMRRNDLSCDRDSRSTTGKAIVS